MLNPLANSVEIAADAWRIVVWIELKLRDQAKDPTERLDGALGFSALPQHQPIQKIRAGHHCPVVATGRHPVQFPEGILEVRSSFQMLGRVVVDPGQSELRLDLLDTMGGRCSESLNELGVPQQLIAQTIFERSREKSSAAEQVQVVTPAAGDHDD